MMRIRRVMFLKKLREHWQHRHELWQKFRLWQKTPYQVAPLSDEEHDCPTCQTHYTGNFCPRCGQWWRIGRYSFRNAFLGFLDIWGLGNRSMFRAIGHLFLRPGYMMRDYLQGRQHAYFPPFKMFFLVTTLGFLVDNGLNIAGHSDIEQRYERIEQRRAEEQELVAELNRLDSEQSRGQLIAKHIITQSFIRIAGFQYDYPNFFVLTVLLFVSGFLYLLFRHAPNFEGGMRYSELIVSLVYLYNMISLYIIPLEFLQLDERIQTMPYLTLPLAFSQLTGHSLLRSAAYTLLAALFYIVLIALMVVIVVTTTILLT